MLVDGCARIDAQDEKRRGEKCMCSIGRGAGGVAVVGLVAGESTCIKPNIGSFRPNSLCFFLFFSSPPSFGLFYAFPLSRRCGEQDVTSV